MSITLEDKLFSIPDDRIVPELNTMLDRTTVSISWDYKREMKVEGYTGKVEIEMLCRKYLQASAFSNPSASVAERLECYDLWEKVHNLYDAGNEALSHTRLYQYLASQPNPFSHYLTRRPNPYFQRGSGAYVAVIAERDLKVRDLDLFAFTPKKFLELWPDALPIAMIEGDEKPRRWVANKRMCEDLFRRCLL